MATRRIATQEKTHLDLDETTAQPESDITPAVPTHIITKLLGFTAAMIILPIGSYFVTRDWLFRGNAAYAGGFAAVMANVVLIGYIIVAFLDDKKEQQEAEAEKKKQR